MNILKTEPHKQALTILATGITIRTILNLLFFTNYGWHAVNHTETWLYYGVAKGTHLTALGLKDPTVWLLRAVGFILPEELLLYAVVFTSTLLSSLTAVLIYYLVKENHGKKAGFTAGLIYASMVEPLALSVVGFTHDHVQLLLVVLSMLLAVKAVKAVGWRRILLAAAYAVLVYYARNINEVIWIGVGVTALYVGYILLEHASENRMNKTKMRLLYPAYITIITILIIAAGRVTLPDFLSDALGVTNIPDFLTDKLEALPQGRFGSADVIPISYSNFWLRNNLLLFLLPFAIPIAVKRKDTIGISLTLIGFSLAFIFDRGTRISDLGVCMLAGHVISDWKESGKTFFNLMGKKTMKTLKKRRLDKLHTVFGVFTVIALSYALYKTETKGIFQNAFILASLGLVITAWRLKKSGQTLAMLSMIVLSGSTVNTLYVLNADARRVGYETEYQLYQWLGRRQEKGLVLTRWDRGYMLEVISGLTAVSTPGRIREEMHNTLWMPEKEAAVLLKRYGVDYVVISSLNFNIVRQNNQLVYALSGGLVFRPENVPSTELTEYLTVYKLRHNLADPQYFKLLRHETDPYTGVELMVYEVAYTLEDRFREGSIVSALTQNYGDGRNVLLNVTVSAAGREFSYLFNETYNRDELTETVYSVPAPFRGLFNCSVTASPIDDEEWGFKGAVAFQNQGEAGEFEVEFILIDSTASQLADRLVVESVDRRRVFFDAGEVKHLNFTFRRKYPYHQYNIANKRNEDLVILDEESVQPVNNGVEVLYVKC